MKSTDKSFYAGILTALNLLDLHGEDTIYAELVALCNVKDLVAFAIENEELEWSGLARHGFTHPLTAVESE